MATRAYNETHREINKIKQREWRANNRERHRAYSRKYNKEHPERRKEQQRKLTARYVRFKASSKSRKLVCSISFEEFKTLIINPCFYCGEPLPEQQWGSGLDRIDSKQGYTTDNVRSCCKICNRAKNILLESEFKQWVTKIYRHWVTVS
jgi:hypothetical protein